MSEVEENRGIIAAEDLCSEEVVEEVAKGLGLFLANEFEASIELMGKKSSYSPYHAITLGFVCFLKSVMTFNPDDIKQASDSLKLAYNLSTQFQKKESGMMSWIKGSSSMKSHTKAQLHAELISAEATLLRAFLAFIQHEGVMTMVKASVNLNGAYGVYKKCWSHLQEIEEKNKNREDNGEGESKEEDDEYYLDPHFSSGVYMGIGGFNMALSMLPPKVLQLFKFIGFNGDRELGLRILEKGSMGDGLRGIMCALNFLLFHTVIGQVFE